MNKSAQLNLYSVSSYTQFGTSSKIGCGFVLAAYDEEDARDEVREFVGERRAKDLEFEPVLLIGLAGLDIEHGMIMHHIPDFL
jgi:hypothetical protein